MQFNPVAVSPVILAEFDFFNQRIFQASDSLKSFKASLSKLEALIGKTKAKSLNNFLQKAKEKRDSL